MFKIVCKHAILELTLKNKQTRDLNTSVEWNSSTRNYINKLKNGEILEFELHTYILVDKKTRDS